VSQTADVVVIIGAGILGGSVAYRLPERAPGPRVVVPDREAEAPAIGILMAEMLLDGRAVSMDISPLSLDRFAAGRLRAEANMF
jgi:glycine/D-amino acid oxidase-like deaminating enzyme